ncbi:transcriptional regulator [Shewanella sp. Choline-02u-19]|uniref:nSTAND1 domain-containing NTPase n=1 Tax=unclassified Shewanella TaxID=196818 RepID=UPI000C3337E3|nr:MULTISPECIES: winged helix-turn-helix domain-containing protein [unclassified Shewanella]PKH53850.1 transcriptional regulator [Shewanella sp. Bg11-22]PKI28898.1 transcriptional regulator [Shewanella sp. Choline-02u-19]
MSDHTFFFGEWQVDPNANSLRAGKQVKQLEPKAMDVLKLLCLRAGEVLSSDDIVNHCWPNTDVGDNPLHKIINQIRRALGDSATSPIFIETIRKRGYRTLAEVRFPIGQEEVAAHQSWQSGSPFPGLQAYCADYADVFFGRGKQISVLLDRISQQIKYGRAFCLTLGPSGSGKSSLINAGIMPNLMTTAGYNSVKVASYSGLDFADVSSSQLFIELASAMLDWELNDLPVFDGYSADTLATTLIDEPNAVIKLCQQALKTQTNNYTHFALFIDRLEILLSSPLFKDEERHIFVELIEHLATSGTVLILSACRNEFYPLLVNYPTLMAGKSRGAHFDLAPPSRSELLQMIRLPAIAANLTWDIDPDSAMPLDEMLCSEAASNPDALPMLQYMLQALYLRRSSDDQLQVTVYQELGGIEGAIGKNAEDAINGLTEKQKNCLPHVLSLLVTLREDEVSITSRTARWSQLLAKSQSESESENALVQAMVDSRLFVSHLQNGEPCFSIAHEALLRRWPRATSWIDEHNTSLQIKSRLYHLAKRWRKEHKNSAYLLADGKPLNEALALQDNPLFTIEPQERALIAASAKQQRSKRWRRHFTIAALCVLSVVSIVMSYKSTEAEKMAQQKRLAAENLLGFMVGDFADKMRGIGRMDLLDGISNKALEYFSADNFNIDNNLSFDANFQHAQTLEAMAEVAYSRNKLDEASTAFHAARSKLTTLLAAQPHNLELLKTLGANAFWIGQLDYDKSDWDAARVWWEQYLTYSQTMFDVAPEDTNALMELAYAQNSLGSVSMKQQDFELSLQSFKQSLKLKQLALSHDKTSKKLIADVANTRSWIASAALAQGDIQAAIKIQLKIQQDLKNNNSNDSYTLDRLASSNHILATLYHYLEQHVDAFEQALLSYRAITEALKNDPKNDIWRIQQYNAYFIMLRFIQYPENLNSKFKPKIIATILKADISLSQSKHLENVWAKYYFAAASYYIKTGAFKQSEQLALKSTELFRGLAIRHPDNKLHLTNLSASELLHASAIKASGSPSFNTQLCQQAKQRMQNIVKINKDPKFTITYIRALACLHQLDSQPELVSKLKISGIDVKPF